MKAPASHIHFPVGVLPASTTSIRQRLRELLERERAAGTWTTTGRSWGASSPELSRALGAEGFIGMTWPRQYGGGECSYLERYVVTEELLASGAPTGFHWVADRQSGPLLLRFGTEEQRQTYLPAIARGELSFCIGMSEPDSGSDLASIRTRAERVAGGWELTGTKIWTSKARTSDWCIVLCRTEPAGEQRHAGMTQMMVDLQATEGVTVEPIHDLAGGTSFNEVVFDRAFVPEVQVLGEPGNGWAQVTSELSYERAGPERFLTNFHLFRDLVRVLSDRSREHAVDDSVKERLGALVARLATLRMASLSVAGRLEGGELPNVESALVKDLGTAFQQQLPQIVREIVAGGGLDDPELRDWLASAMLAAPAYTIQGGTTEILRGIIARGLKLR